MTTGRPPGRPSVPPELKLLRGTDRSGSRPTPGEPVGTLPDAPELGDAGRAAWELYWQHGRTWLAETDRPLLERLCRLIDDAAAMRAVLAEEGLTHRNRRTGRSAAHSLYNSLLGLHKQIASLEAACGFTPADRGRLHVATSADDPLTRWLATGNSG